MHYFTKVHIFQPSSRLCPMIKQQNKTVHNSVTSIFVSVSQSSLSLRNVSRSRVGQQTSEKSVVITTLLDPRLVSTNVSPEVKLTKVHFKRIAFLKVHKAGSTTAQNIFLRYGEYRNLTFVLPIIREDHLDNVISVQSTLNDKNILPPPQNRTYDILCCHVLYSSEAFHKYMPTDTAYIGIVREPFDQFLSTLNYFRAPHIFERIKAHNKVLKYLQDPTQYKHGLPYRWSMTNNRMAIEFGFPSNLFRQYLEEESMNYLTKLDKEFQFVIIMEYFTESVVMMRRILGWTTKDVLYLRKDSARWSYSFADNTHRHLYERFAKLDYDLYNFFYRRLWSQIQKEGLDFNLELLYFDRLRKEVEDYCTYTVDKSSGYIVAASMWSATFVVSRDDCDYLKKSELFFVERIRRRQYGFQKRGNLMEGVVISLNGSHS
ncbi:galactose-3-O-sulfotransferase 2-like [Mytilus californianus]|uniref:galactose-3-O-sulfotransferase 2-like n=1 Tax=Mytilus californianus TaxID=6549 RepID=UPI002245F6AC|nr:galactose-3-O-sulfotransferase 2-like [Mytilus californianus]